MKKIKLPDLPSLVGAIIGFLIIAVIAFLCVDWIIIKIGNIPPVQSACTLTSGKLAIKVTNTTGKEITFLAFDVEPVVTGRVFWSYHVHLEPDRAGYFTFAGPDYAIYGNSLQKCEVEGLEFADGTRWWQKSFIIWP